MKIYEYGGYVEDNGKDIIIAVGSSRKLWHYIDTLADGLEFNEFEILEGTYKTRKVSNNVVEIKNNGDKDLVLRHIRNFRK